MTLLNQNPIKGSARNFLTKKFERAHWWYVLNGKTGEVSCIVSFPYGLGLGGAVILEDKKGKLIAMGYNLNLSEVKPYIYETQRHKRGL